MEVLSSIIQITKDTAIRGKSRIAICAGYGVSCEGWLKVELLDELTKAFYHDETIEILPEWKKHDLLIRRSLPAESYLIELKTFPTNYMRGGKPITNFVNYVILDLKKLSEKRRDSTIGLEIWMAYVIPDPIPNAWWSHLNKIKSFSGRMLLDERIPLWNYAFANLYIMQSK